MIIFESMFIAIRLLKSFIYFIIWNVW